jgi:hypothetical protein
MPSNPNFAFHRSAAGQNFAFQLQILKKFPACLGSRIENGVPPGQFLGKRERQAIKFGNSFFGM